MRTQVQVIAVIKIVGLMLLSIFPLTSLAEPAVVGKVDFARGSVAAQQPGQAARILGKDSDILQGDNIQTAERSFVIVEFSDGAKVTVRPNSNFSIDQYDSDASDPKAELSLHEGGVRADSGEIARANPENFAVKTELGTVTAAQQADYSVRLCKQDCAAEQSTEAAPAAVQGEADAVARVVDLKGEVSARNRADPNAEERKLALGGALYSKDYLRSQADSYALMVFRDGQKITLQANSELDIADYRFQQPGAKDNALYRLTTGGMRALTGSIGKTDKNAYAVETPVGTIGIRGTGFDISCVGDCIGDTARPVRATQNFSELAEGLYTHVWQGQIALSNDAGEHLLSMPGSHYIANRNAVALELPYLPDTLFNNLTPRPDKSAASLHKLFAASAAKGKAAGLYVAVHKGRVQIDNRDGRSNRRDRLALDQGEAGRVDPDKNVARLTRPAAFQQQDRYLSGPASDARTFDGDVGSPFTDGDNVGGNGCQNPD